VQFFSEKVAKTYPDKKILLSLSLNLKHTSPANVSEKFAKHCQAPLQIVKGKFAHIYQWTFCLGL
jgi:hypothetical protein